MVPPTSASSSLAPAAWRAREQAHQRRADAFTRGYRERAGTTATHPVDDFLFTYYPLRPGLLRRWHPGSGVVLEGATDSDRAGWKWYHVHSGDLSVDTAAFVERNERSIRYIVSLLSVTASRPANLGCFGLHEWAMVYRAGEAGASGMSGMSGASGASAGAGAAATVGAGGASMNPTIVATPAEARGGGRRHDVPLRLGQAATDAVVESHNISCTHFDAYRFFTPDALPLNRAPLTRESQPLLEQPGCLHAGMDVYKWATKLGPLIPGELLLDCFELARDIRQLDMRASPYDLGDWGYTPIAIETPAGKAEYSRQQAAFAERGNVLRLRVVGAVAGLLPE
jgi:hypothetical protein